MNLDARINVGIATHPKTIKLERALGADGFRGLICVLLWTAQHRPTGDLSGLEDEDLEHAIGWRGKAGHLMNVLRQVGYVDGDPGASRIHDWVEHNSWASGAPERSQKARLSALTKYHGSDRAREILSQHKRRKSLSDNRQTSLLAAGEPDANGMRDPSAPSPSPSPSPKEEVRSRATRLPKPFEMPPEWRREALGIVAKMGRQVDVGVSFQKFCNHWWGMSGFRGTKLDWLATWRNWVITDCERAPARPAAAMGTLGRDEVD